MECAADTRAYAYARTFASGVKEKEKKHEGRRRRERTPGRKLTFRFESVGRSACSLPCARARTLSLRLTRRKTGGNSCAEIRRKKRAKESRRRLEDELKRSRRRMRRRRRRNKRRRRRFSWMERETRGIWNRGKASDR